MDQPPGGQESPDYEETLAQSKSGSSSANYSNYSSDLFESTSDESSWNYESDSFESLTNDSVPNYESDTFESYSHVKSHEVLFSETISSISEAYEEVSDRHNTENDLIGKWITILVKRKLQLENSSRPQLSTVSQPNYTESACSPLLSYCSKKIRHLHQQPTLTQVKKPHPGKLWSSTHRDPSCYIPSAIMNRLQMQNVNETMKQVIQAKMHDPASCPDCIHKQAELAQSQFVRMRSTKLEADLINMKLEEYPYKKDLITCIGEIHQTLPKPSDGRSAIWQRLCNSVRT